MFDAKQMARADSPLNCNPNDNATQIISMSNTIFNMTSAFTGTPHHGFIVSFLQWYNRQNMKIEFANNTMYNIQQSFYRPLLLDAYYATIVVTNNYWNKITSSVDVALIHTIKDVTLTNNTFRVVSSTS